MTFSTVLVCLLVGFAAFAMGISGDVEEDGVALLQSKAKDAFEAPCPHPLESFPPADPNVAVLKAYLFNEKKLYEGAVFFGHQNPDADAVCSAYGAAAFFGGTPSCPMERSKCPNDETAYIMQTVGVDASEVPILEDMKALKKQHFVIVDFNAVGAGPPGLPWLVGADGLWDTKYVYGVIDHHSVQLPPSLETPSPQLLYAYSGNIIIETHGMGSVCTIMGLKFKLSGKTPSKKVAGMLLGGILSDTLGLTGPTTTEFDREAVSYLQPLSTIPDYNQFYQGMSYAKSAGFLTYPIEQVLDSDLKVYSTVHGVESMIIAAVEIANQEIYEGFLARDPTEWADAIKDIRYKYQHGSGANPDTEAPIFNVFAYVVNVQDKVSTLVTDLVGDDACIVMAALAQPPSPDTIYTFQDPSKECRPDFPPGPTKKELGGPPAEIAQMPSGTCTSRKLQAQLFLEQGVREHAGGHLTC